MIKIGIEVENRELNISLDKWARKTPKLSRRIIGRLAEAVIAHSVKNYLSGQVLKRKTGTLAKSLNYKMLNDWSAEVGTNVAYGAIHEFGGVITPVNAKALKFKTETGWVTTQKVVMPARPYLAPAFNAIDSQGIIDRTTEEYIKREWNK